MLQKYVFAFVMLHFTKHRFETLTHQFSYTIMAARLIVKNSAQ